jgi:hypothetical protein
MVITVVCVMSEVNLQGTGGFLIKPKHKAKLFAMALLFRSRL